MLSTIKYSPNEKMQAWTFENTSVTTVLFLYLRQYFQKQNENGKEKGKKIKTVLNKKNLNYCISRRISRVSGHQNRGQKIDLDLYEGHIISVVRLLIKNLACLAICSFWTDIVLSLKLRLFPLFISNLKCHFLKLENNRLQKFKVDSFTVK